MDALKACSLTSKHFLSATRPLIHQRLYLTSDTGQTLEYPGPRRPSLTKPFSCRESVPEAFERLIDADRSGLLCHTRHLTFKIINGTLSPTNVQEHLPHLQSITKLRDLTLVSFDVHPFIPVFNQCFGMFTNALRHLGVQHAWGAGEKLLYIVCQFPLLEDLTIVSLIERVVRPGHPKILVPTIAQSPPLGGKLFLAHAYSKDLFEGLAALPGGPNFRSLESIWRHCADLQDVLTASHTVTSVSSLWQVPDTESNPSISRISRCNRRG